MSGKNSIQVAIKVRPLKEKDQQSSWRVVDNSIQLIDSQTDPYYFDHIFDQDATNQIIFDKMAKQIVHSAIQGFNGTIFAYGQTSSGKTYTMMGDEDNPGVMVLAAKEIFRDIERTQDRQFLLRVGYIEIYNEKIYDLLNKKNQDLKIHETSTGIVSVNCEECIIRSEDDLLNHLNKGSKERKVGETNMNERSSRSHAIFRIIIESRKMDRSEDDAVIQSVINLVDLAGSERADQTGARGTRLKEGGHINKSLMFLSNVIKRLSENEDDKYISYRDSKLTRILQASLGGNGLTAIICTIKPNAVEETQSTLNFALRAKTIKNKPQVNEIVTDATMMKRLEREIKILKSRLEEEQRKNESQIKVRQLEQRIKDEDLKIISYNSLHSTRNREKRRRTWCPSSTNLDTSGVNQQPSALPISTLNSHLPSNLPQASRLQAPKTSYYNTPLITLRPTAEPQSALMPSALPKPPDYLAEIDEEFADAELVNFDMLPSIQTPKNQQTFRKCSITPKLAECPRSTLAKVEHDLMELQSFTNLENKTEVQYDPDLALKQQIETLRQRNTVLENERLDYLQLKDEFAITSNNLLESQKRSEELQIQISKLTNSNKIANEKIAKYEAEVAALKKTNEKLEMENREAVNLEFEFQRHKNKSKLRETELLEALNEKEKEVNKLERSLNVITAERIQNSKEELLHKSQSDECQETENGKVCIKCVDLQRLLDENNKITLEFEKLTLEYEKLKLNYTEIERESETNKLKITELQELQEKEKAVSDKLLEDVQKLRDKLQNVQRDYEQLSTENSSKNEECMALSRQVEVARKEMMVLEEKFTKLETSWQEQQQTLCDIEAQYASIQTKYQQLQCEYEQLEVTRGQSLTDCQRLERENVELQTEIEDLKKKVQDAQEKLLKSNEMFEVSKKECAMANEERLSETSKIQQDNETLKQQLLDMQTQFEDLQKEYEDLSNQFMDSLQESESLKNENIKVQEKLKEYEMKNGELSTTTDDEINNLRPQLEKVFASESKSVLKTPSPCRNSSMRSSGVCVTEEADVELEQYTEDMFKKFCELSESLTEIELEHTKGNTKVFKSASKNSTPNYKMYLKNIFGVRKSQKEFNMEIENVHLQGSFNHHSFHIVELSGENKSCEKKCDNVDINGCDDEAEYIEKLKQEIADLRAVHEQECSNNKLMLESTERALAEMREQFEQLTAELMEKSIFVENCACKTYQQQIEALEKEKANITVMCEELQEKVNCTLSGSFSNLMNNTISSNEIKIEDQRKDLEILKLKEQELEELTQRYKDLENDLQTAREKLETQEKEYEEKCNQLRLQNLEKLALSANEYRDNIKKYNNDWEDKKEHYELTIQELRQQIEQFKLLESNNKDLELAEETQQENNRGDVIVDTHNKSDMTDDLKIIQREKLDLEEAKQSLEQQLSCLEEQLENVQQENNKYIKEMCLLDNKISTLDDQLSNLSNEKVSLTVQLEELKEELKCVPQLQRDNQELTDEVDRLNSEHNDLLQKLHKTEIQIENLCTEDSKREKLIGALESKLTHLETIEEQKKVLENEVGLLKDSCSQLQETLKAFYEKEQEYETIKREVTTIKENCDKLSESQRELLAKNCTLEEKLQRHITDKVMLETQLNELNEEKTTLLGNYAVLQKAKDALEEQLNCLKGKEEVEVLLERVMKEKAELNQKVRVITDKMEFLEAELAHKEEEIKAEREQNANIQTNLLATKELLNEKQQQLVETEKEKEKMKQDGINISEELEKLKQNVIKTNEDKEEQEKEIYNLKQQLVTINEKLCALLGEKCERQLDFGKVKQAQNNLQKYLEALSKTLKEKQQEFKDLENNYHKAQSENEELQKQVKELNVDLTNSNTHNRQQLEEFAKLQQDLQVAKDSLASLTDEKLKLQEQLESCKSLKEDKSKLERTLNIIKSAQAGAITKLQQERNQLHTTVKQYEVQHAEFKEKEETLNQKIETLTQQLHEFRCKTQTYEKLLAVHEEVETALSKATIENQKLREDVSQLKGLSGEIEKLNLEMDKHLNEKRNLETELSSIKKTLQDEKSSLQRELQEMNSCVEELKLKCNSLRNTNTQLESLNQQLEQQTKDLSNQLKAFHNLQDDFDRVKSQNIELQHNLKTKIEDAGRCSLALREEVKHYKELVQKRQENLNLYKNEMETKYHSLEKENLKLSSNIATLQIEKQTLEEKLRKITVRNFEQDLQRQAIDATANTSGDLNKSASPKGRRSQERLSAGGGEIKFANISLEEKLSAIQQKNSTTTERKNRRLSTHDERRRQSFWGATHDKETMTDPMNNSCNCLELDGKLKECERNLFIKNSQVTALNMQLKNHPLKDENAALMKRLLEEQEKHRTEIKRYKNKLQEMVAKADKAIAAAAHATLKSNHAAVTAATVAEQNSTPIMPVIMANVEVQTDDDFSSSLHKLQGKYVDLKNICRYRFNLIKELEAKVMQKENTDGNGLSALEAAENKLLNNQCESLKRELKTVKEKYENAKKVLHSRREEIQKLRAQLEGAQ